MSYIKSRVYSCCLRDSLLRGNMSKNFSVEWLSQSSRSRENSHKPRSRGPGSASKASFHPEGERVETEKLPSSPANSCGYTSASESDVSDDSEGESGPHRRVRTKFTSEQISRLERTFNKHKYLGATQRRRLAEKLHLSETQVKTWFQNRRMKLKREVQDMRTAHYFVPSLLPPVTSFQHHAVSGQRPRHMYVNPAQRIPVHPIMFTSGYF